MIFYTNTLQYISLYTSKLQGNYNLEKNLTITLSYVLYHTDLYISYMMLYATDVLYCVSTTHLGLKLAFLIGQARKRLDESTSHHKLAISSLSLSLLHTLSQIIHKQTPHGCTWSMYILNSSSGIVTSGNFMVIHAPVLRQSCAQKCNTIVHQRNSHKRKQK